MKAILKVNKKSTYAPFNGHTFEVNEVRTANVNNPIFALNIDGAIVDFTAKEVMVVDFQQEWYNGHYALTGYKQINKIVVYNKDFFRYDNNKIKSEELVSDSYYGC